MKFISTIIFLLFVISSASAADMYVRKGAAGAGNGTSWTDAWTEFSNVSTSGMSGNILWVAAGSYTSSLAAVSVTNLTIKRATIASHGSATGWLNAYDGQVTVSASSTWLDINTTATNLVVDGQTWNPWSFRIVGVRGLNGQIRNEGADGVVIRGLELDGAGENSVTNGPEDGIRWMGGANGIIEHDFIHDYQQYATSSNGGAAVHNDAIQAPYASNLTIRYNVWKNNGQHLFLGDCEWWPTGLVTDASIHHNLFYNESGISSINSYNTIVMKGTRGNFYVENNTFAVRTVDYPYPRNIMSYSGSCTPAANSAALYFRNNIVYASDPGVSGSGTHAYNAYYGGGYSYPTTETGRVITDPLFTNASGYVFSLQASSPAIDAGTTLGYTTDLIGAALPQGAGYDIGAYEYVSGTLVNGVCGSSNGGTFTSAPSSNLCSTGTPSTVSGTGPWTWTCAGSNGGTTASCSASLTQSGNGVAVFTGGKLTGGRIH